MSNHGLILVPHTEPLRSSPRRRPSTVPSSQVQQQHQALSVNVVVTIASLAFCVMLILFIIGGLVLLNRANDAIESVEVLKSRVESLAPRSRIAAPVSEQLHQSPTTKLLSGSATTGATRDTAAPEDPPQKSQRHLIHVFTMTHGDVDSTELIVPLTVQFESEYLELADASVCCLDSIVVGNAECIPKQQVTVKLLARESERRQKIELRVADMSYASRSCWLLALAQND